MSTSISEPPVPIGVVESFRFAFTSPTRLRKEVLSGLVVGLALIPEAISFAIVAGLDPRVGLYTAIVMAVTISFTGGRPAMISAATGAVALVIAPVTQLYGQDYVVATVLLAGIFQLLMALLGVAKLMRFIPRSVMVGFINSLAALILIAQFEHVVNVPWLVYPLVIGGIVTIIAWQKINQVIPAPLVVIVVITALAWVFNFEVPTVGDQGELPDTLPEILIPQVPYTLETLEKIAPFAFTVALVGLMESLLTAKLVDDITDTHSNKTREATGQGIANILTSFIGGMGGCAIIGQTMINVQQARTRLSTLLAGVFLFALSYGLGEIVGRIPMAALVAVMIMVFYASFDWHSVKPSTLRAMPLSETLVMVVTFLGTVITHNLAIGVGLGVLTAMVAFARRVSHVVNVEKQSEGYYAVTGQLFWASSNDLVYSFDYDDQVDTVIIDMTAAEIWDASSVATFNAIERKYAARGKTVEIIGLDGASKQRLDKLRDI